MVRPARRVLERHPWVGAALAYVVLGLAVLAPSIRPGHTVVPADTLTHYSPYREQAGGFRSDNFLLADAATQFLPWTHFLGDELHHGRVPEWNPDILGGVRATPNGYVSPYYPAFWLTAVLDAFDAYNLIVLVQLVVGALGIYALSRTLGARPLPSFVAGLLAPACGMWLHWSLHLVHAAGMVWLPWAMAASYRVLERPTARRVAALAAVLGVWWLGANPQYAYDGGLALAGWLVVLLLVRRRELPVARSLAGLGAAVAVGFLVAAPVLLPTLSSADTVLRAHEPAASMTQTHLPLRHLIRLAVPDATGNPADGFVYGADAEEAMDSPYVGLSALLLGVAALAATGRAAQRRTAIVLAAGVVVGLGLVFLGFPHAVLRAVLPAYDRFRGAARWAAVLPAFALPLAALGLDAVLDGDRRARRATAIAAGVAVLGVAAWLLRELGVSDRHHGYFAVRAGLAVGVAAVVAAAVSRTATRRRSVALALVLAAVLFEVAWSAPRWYPDVEERTAYPPVAAMTAARQRGGRIVRVDRRRDFPNAVPPDVPMVYDVPDVSGLTPVFPKDWDRYLRSIDDYGDVAEELNVSPPLRSAALLRDPRVLVLDVRTALDRRARPTPVDGLGPAVVVRDARPATEDQAWAATAKDWDPTATAAVVGLRRPVSGRGGTVARLAGGRPDRETWEVDAPDGGFLRVASRFDGDWSATVDGRSTDVLRADGPFRGVVVPAGRHRVEFVFRNGAEHLGRWLALVGLVLVAGLAAVARVNRD